MSDGDIQDIYQDWREDNSYLLYQESKYLASANKQRQCPTTKEIAISLKAIIEQRLGVKLMNTEVPTGWKPGKDVIEHINFFK